MVILMQLQNVKNILKLFGSLAPVFYNRLNDEILALVQALLGLLDSAMSFYLSMVLI